jgi:ornithine cyclodeaminase/alanine dehydrogenase-like protein (mu-crystallin family)
VQARLQLEALRLVRPIERAVVWARTTSEAGAFATSMSDELGAAGRRGAVTRRGGAGCRRPGHRHPATEPLVDLGVLHPGLHITAVGSDAEHKQELAAQVVAAADLVVCDHRGPERPARGAAGRRAGFDPDEAVELGRGHRRPPGPRRSSDAVTICDLTGTGAQDTAIATLATTRCLEAGAGIRVDT